MSINGSILVPILPYPKAQATPKDINECISFGGVFSAALMPEIDNLGAKIYTDLDVIRSLDPIQKAFRCLDELTLTIPLELVGSPGATEVEKALWFRALELCTPLREEGATLFGFSNILDKLEVYKDKVIFIRPSFVGSVIPPFVVPDTDPTYDTITIYTSATLSDEGYLYDFDASSFDLL